MYNSKRFETVKNMRENKKISNAVQAAIGVLAVVLAALIVWMMVLVSGIQGTARVVNYAGLVRGETQRLVKMEIAGQAEDEMMESVESFINGLRFGDDELTLVRLDDKSFQTKMEELASCFESPKSFSTFAMMRRALRKPIRKSARPLWRFWSGTSRRTS